MNQNKYVNLSKAFKSLVPIVIFLFATGCDQNIREENRALLMKVDSLEIALETSEYTIGLLEAIGQYLDSIDMRSESILLDLELGVADKDYLQKVKNLNAYFQKTEWAIRELESISGMYSVEIDRLKSSVDEKNDEINRLQISVNQYRNLEDSLRGRLEITEVELKETQRSLDFSRMDVALGEMEIAGLMEMVQLTEAEIHFAEGEGLEEIAKKIKFAPKKKRKNLEAALNAFTTSFEMGYMPARLRMERLKETLESE